MDIQTEIWSYVINMAMQIPLAGVVVFVVWMFLRYLRETLSLFMSALKEQSKVMTELSNSVEKMNDELSRRIEALERDLLQRYFKHPE